MLGVSGSKGRNDPKNVQCQQMLLPLFYLFLKLCWICMVIFLLICMNIISYLCVVFSFERLRVELRRQELRVKLYESMLRKHRRDLQALQSAYEVCSDLFFSV